MYKGKRFYRDMTPAKAEEIRRLYFQDRIKQTDIAQRFGIRQCTVSRIISDAVWCRP